ncbi:HEPN domain-containing protein [Acetobacter conturbans]|uniref:RiboL-PSP-HEPN domain-containing protein n=1 Tax=Acetobacter conturbans TaxID=1737472 RepID=A0ABX0K6Y5_9PROT|nr:HEPN domain-containing protein [Acetobacter conturbans]NHN89960.1 hypothetical protein [Acetobacter conturbans]
MSTAVFEVAITLPQRMGEVRKLVEKAELCNETDPEFRDALCRSASVLLVSHVEGFLKDVVSSICADLNYFVRDFSRMPESMKRDFSYRISHYDGVPKCDIEKRTNKIKEFFTINSVPIDFDFLPIKENMGNPTVSSIDKYFTPIGINKIVSSLSSDFYHQIFSGSASSAYKLLRKCKSSYSKVYSWPYQAYSNSDFKEPPNKGDPYATDALWATFIEDMLRRRHKIAHGSTLENTESTVNLERDINKVEIMITGIMIYACGKIGSYYRA